MERKITVVVLFESVTLGKPSDVQPVSGPTLPEMLGGEKFVHHLFE